MQTQETLQESPQSTTQAEGPTLAGAAPVIMVTGASRSGTTMLARMLGSHSRIMGTNELQYFGDLWDPYDDDRELSEKQLTDLATTLQARQNRGPWCGSPTAEESAWGQNLVAGIQAGDRTTSGLFAAVMQRLAQDAGKEIGCEQTPRNIFYAKRLLELYPRARIIHIVRDPRAVLASQKNRWKLKKLGADHLPWAEMLRNRVNYHPYTMGKLWAKANQEALQLKDHPRFMILRFEDLAADPEGGGRRLCEFLGVDYQPEILNISRWGSSNVSHSTESKGVSKDVIDKWRENLSNSEILINEKVTKDIMSQLDYSPELIGKHGVATALPELLMYPLHLAGVVAFNPKRAWVQFRALTRTGN